MGYPGLKKYPHLVGNYGGAWQDQRQEFDAFPGAIVMTTNCIQQPKDSYHDRIFTMGLVAWPGVTHIGLDRDFSPVIEAALAAPGFTATEPKSAHIVEQILDDFRSGRQSLAEFRIEFQGKFIHIRYFAVRDEQGTYAGTLQVTQDLTRLRALQGERRLLQYGE